MERMLAADLSLS